MLNIVTLNYLKSLPTVLAHMDCTYFFTRIFTSTYQIYKLHFRTTFLYIVSFCSVQGTVVVYIISVFVCLLML